MFSMLLKSELLWPLNQSRALLRMRRTCPLFWNWCGRLLGAWALCNGGGAHGKVATLFPPLLQFAVKGFSWMRSCTWSPGRFLIDQYHAFVHCNKRLLYDLGLMCILRDSCLIQKWLTLDVWFKIWNLVFIRRNTFSPHSLGRLEHSSLTNVFCVFEKRSLYPIAQIFSHPFYIP